MAYSFGPSIVMHEDSLNSHTINDNSNISVVSQTQEYSDDEPVYEDSADEKSSVTKHGMDLQYDDMESRLNTVLEE